MNSARPTSTSSQEQHNSYINMHWNSKWKEIALCTTCCRLFHQMVNTPSFKMVQTWPLWNLPISFKSRPLPPRRAWRSVDSNVCQSKPSTRECSSERTGTMARSTDGAPIHSRRHRAPFTAPKSQCEGWDWSRSAPRALSTTVVSLHARRQVGKLIRKCFVLPRGVDDLVVLVEWQNS
jgi:hypothetical protein